MTTITTIIITPTTAATTSRSTTSFVSSTMFEACFQLMQELLSKQNLAVAYLCLDVAAPALGLRGARDYLSLQSLQAGLEQRIVDCLETRASQQAHTAPHSFDIPLLHNATFEPLVSEGSLRVCIPPPSISANGSFYVDGRVENVAVYLLGIRQRHTVSMFVERSGPIVIVTPEGELASFTVDLRQWLFQYETGMCRPITSPEKSCQQNDFSRVSAYGCWKVTVLEFDSLPLEEVTGLRFVFDISARVKVNVSSKAAMVMFPDMNEQRAMRAAQCF